MEPSNGCQVLTLQKNEEDLWCEESNHNEPREDIKCDDPFTPEIETISHEIPHKLGKVKSIMSVDKKDVERKSRKHVMISENDINFIPGECSGIIPKMRSMKNNYFYFKCSPFTNELTQF
jgi:hypothetical protein